MQENQEQTSQSTVNSEQSIVGSSQITNHQPQVTKSSFLVILLSILLVISLSIAGFFTYQTQKLVNELRVMRDELKQASTPTASTEPTTDPTMGWKTYANKAHNVTFKYPSDWVLNIVSEGDVANGQTYNTSLNLKNMKSVINIFLNLDGIGGVGQTLQGQPTTISGYKLYRYEKENTFNNTLTIGVTDSLTESLGVFRINGITYSITLNFPISYSSTEQLEAETVFDQILSTFKFTN